MNRFFLFRTLPVLLLATIVAGCGERQPEADPAAVDQTLNTLIARDEAERRQLVEEARAREEAREREMEARQRNYSNTTD